MQRLQFELTEEKVKELETLMKEGGITTKKDLINNALTFLEWAMNERKAGRIIASVDRDEKRFKEITMPIFSAVTKYKA